MGRVTSRNSDSNSDLSVYIYSNGFFTANEDNSEVIFNHMGRNQQEGSVPVNGLSDNGLSDNGQS